MNYKFITFKESEDFLKRLKKREVVSGCYVIDRKYIYAVVIVLGGNCDICFFRTLKGCKKYISKEMTLEEIGAWEEKVFMRREMVIYILYYSTILSLVILLFYLMKS